MQRDQKIIPSPPVGKLDSQGRILIDLTIPYAELKLETVLGDGAYGTVYKGRWKSSDVAIKKLKVQKFSASALEEFRQEAQIMFQLGNESDQIVRLKKICLESPNYSLVMELMPKGSLYELLHNNQELPWPMRYQIALDIAHGLEALHGYNILHRDLKSLNVLLGAGLRAKLTDFGLSKIKQETSSQSSHPAKGTPQWMAPELFDDEPQVTKASDIYSLGMVYWELATRAIPFAKAPNQQVVLGWIMRGKKETIPVDCPAELKQLITDCWDVPAKRPVAVKVVDRLLPLLESKEALGKSPDPSAVESLATPLSLLSVSPKPSGYAAGAESAAMSARAVAEGELKQHQQEIERLKAENEKLKREQATVMPQQAPVIPSHPAVIPPQALVIPRLDRGIQSDLPSGMDPAIKSRDDGQMGRDDGRAAQDDKRMPGSPSQSPYALMPAPKPALKAADAKEVAKLLKFVAEGEQDQAEGMIKQNPQLLLVSGEVKDLSERTFKSITAFQYAVWARDYHMWTMIRKYLPLESQAEQFTALETKGTEHGKQYEIKPLTEALQVYVDNASKWNYDQRAIDQWCKKVGGAQRLLPVHVANEYCRKDRAFEPCPVEWESKLPRTREVSAIWDGSRHVKGSWYVAPSSQRALGTTFAFLRYNYKSARPRDRAPLQSWEGGRRDGDLKSLTTLWKARTQQCELLKSELTSVVSSSQKLKEVEVLESARREEEAKQKPVQLPQPEVVSPQSNPYAMIPAPKPAIKAADAKEVAKLLKFVAEGEQDAAEAMIKQNPQLLLAAGEVKDLSGRTFKEVTGFQYALWALDWHMWKMILKYLPEDAAAEQFKELESKGTEHGKHYDMKPLTEALQTYVDNAGKWNYDERAEDQWCKKVGGAQRNVPAHVVNEYCREDRSFYPCPEFKEEKLPRTRTVDMYKNSQYVKEDWFTASSQGKLCGDSFAFSRGGGCLCRGAFRQGYAGVVGRSWRDIKALQSLLKARTQQLEMLASQLKTSSIGLGAR